MTMSDRYKEYAQHLIAIGVSPAEDSVRLASGGTSAQLARRKRWTVMLLGSLSTGATL